MAHLTLGNTPIDLEVRLTQDADFICGMDSLDGDWPESAVATLVFPTTSWQGVTAGASIDWNIDKVEVNALIDTRPSWVQLKYVDGDTDITWGSGRVTIYGTPA